MQSVKNLIQTARGKLNKYWIAVIVAFFFTFVIGEHNIFVRISYDRKIRKLEKEIEYYVLQKENNLQRLHELRSDNEHLEKLARESFRMVKPNEELFIIKE
jgi:cell division protein FtsB